MPRLSSARRQCHHRAVEQHKGHSQKVVGGDAILRAMGAAGIHRDIARDGASQLAGRVGRVEETLMGEGSVNPRLVMPFDPDKAVGEVDLEDPVHLRRRPRRSHLPAGWHRRRGMSRRRGAPPSAVLMAEPEVGRHFGGRRRQHDRERHLAIGGQAVGLESALSSSVTMSASRKEPCQTPTISVRRNRISLSVFCKRLWSWLYLPASADGQRSLLSFQKVAAPEIFFQ